MNTFLFFVFSVGAAAFIGGLTNYFAIRMLFHPRRAVWLFGRRLPFTPGLIPKRKEEIAHSLGRVVGDYLVTTDVLQKALRDGRLQNMLAARLQKVWREWCGQPATLAERMAGIWGSEVREEIKKQFSQGAAELLKRVFSTWWRDDAERITVAGLIPGWSERAKARWAARGAEWIRRFLMEELASERGFLLFRDLIRHAVRSAGGMWGAIAGVFLDEEQAARKMRQAVLRYLDHPAARRLLEDMLENQFAKWEGRSLKEAAEMIAGDERHWEELVDRAFGCVRRAAWLDKALERSVSDLDEESKQWVEAQIPHWVTFLLQQAVRHAGWAVHALNLPGMVQKQVDRFPVERLEELVLQVSGREFRAITWLGVLLGGLIGFFQACLVTLGGIGT